MASPCKDLIPVLPSFAPSASPAQVEPNEIVWLAPHRISQGGAAAPAIQLSTLAGKHQLLKHTRWQFRRPPSVPEYPPKAHRSRSPARCGTNNHKDTIRPPPLVHQVNDAMRQNIG